MKTNKLIKFAASLMLCCMFFGCTPEEETEKLGTIYGTVTDFATGEPVGNANVKLRPSGETTLTGSDGAYEFNELKAGNYSLMLSKAEYADLDDDYIIELEAGKQVKRDVQLRKKVASLKILDMSENPLDTLDFGSEESVRVKTFNVFNDGTETLTCSVEYDCEWITNVSGLENQIQSGQTVPVTVKIDRVALADGVNTTFMSITSANGSNEIVVKATFMGAAVIKTKDATNVTSNSVTLGGNITDDGGRPVIARGICYGTMQSPDVYGDHTEDGSGTGEFNHNVSGLSASTTYYARAYATNRNGTYYASNIVSFTTTDGTPTVTTENVTNITLTTAKSGGNVINNGGHTVTARGICWNTMGSPDLNDQHTTNGNGNGSFTSNMTNLIINTTYFVRAYATNSHGTSYGNEVVFTTSDGSASITLSSPTNITATSASCNANVTNDGGAAITERGICWSTSQYPTITNSHTAVGNGTGSFTGSMNGLTPSTTYYVRAYAINAAGSSYSNQVAFNTERGLPSLTTTMPVLNGTNVTTGGNITNDSGFSITTRGVCYGPLPNPDLSVPNNHTNNGNGIGYFTSSFSLSNGVDIYYIRAYATNANGTAYGNQVVLYTAYYELLSFSYGGHIYRIAPPNNNGLTWRESKAYCDNLSLYGYSDWILPSKDMLTQMYNQLNNNFDLFEEEYNYNTIWSSSYYGYNDYNNCDRYYVVNFYYGLDYFGDNEDERYGVIPVRLEQ